MAIYEISTVDGANLYEKSIRPPNLFREWGDMIYDTAGINEADIENMISNIDVLFTEKDLAEQGFVLNNIVGSLRLDRQLDLSALSSDLNNTDYHPETYPSMIYRPFGSDNSVSVLTPSSGKLAIVGAKNTHELQQGTTIFLEELDRLGIPIETKVEDILIQNIVANYDLGLELNLSVVALSLGLEDVEYEPEQFPGIVYRSSGDSTILIFSTGKCVITGAKTFQEVVRARDEVVEILHDIGVELDHE